MTKHFDVKGIPIDGEIRDFIEKVKDIGFTLTYAEGGTPFLYLNEGIAILTGKFVNHICEIVVCATPLTKTVWNVVFLLPEDNNWISLKETFDKLKYMFISKYGSPSESIDRFIYPYDSDDYDKIVAIRNNMGTFLYLWRMENGTILLHIKDTCNIKIAYEDKQNQLLCDKESDMVIYDDI